jgi:hypothetical protein
VIDCSVHDCINRQESLRDHYTCGKNFGFTFPKDTITVNAWDLCRLKTIVCALTTSRKNQIQRDLATLEQYGYDETKILLKSDAVPDVPMSIPGENIAIAVSLPTKHSGGATN